MFTSIVIYRLVCHHIIILHHIIQQVCLNGCHLIISDLLYSRVQRPVCNVLKLHSHTIVTPHNSLTALVSTNTHLSHTVVSPHLDLSLYNGNTVVSQCVRPAPLKTPSRSKIQQIIFFHMLMNHLNI